jgi:hypothetical protein
MTDVVIAPEARSEGWLDGLVRGLYVIRVPLAMAVITMLVLTLSDQAREIHRVLTQEHATNFLHLHWLLALASLAALSIVLWQVARQHAEDASTDATTDSLEPHRTCVWMLRWGPRLIIMLPLLGTALGIWLSRSPYIETTDVPPSLAEALKTLAKLQTDFAIGAAVCVGLALVLFLLTVAFERMWAPHGSGAARKVAIFSNWLLFPAVILASIVLLVRDPVHLPQLVGSIPIFALFMANLAVLFGLFSRYYRVFGVPFLGALIVLLICFEVLGLTDNHRFRHQEASIQRPSAEVAFRSWLTSRQDAKAYSDANKPYPVYIVAAEGGGLYAGYQTAKFLARMQDLCPNFSQHVFAISSVSGGSLGAAVYAGLARSSAKNEDAKPCLEKLEQTGPVEKQASKVLSGDLLAPVMWAGLFPDFLQRFIPYPIGVFDRARALEFAFEQAWQQAGVAGPNPLRESIFALCGPGQPACAAGATPALAFNTTNVETGMQMVLSPLDFTSIGAPWFSTGKVFDIFSTGVEPVDMPLSTAVGLSARFPWVSPTGWFDFVDPSEKDKLGANARRRRMSFVDGGYVDNSGVATASKLAESLAEYVGRETDLPKIELKLIMISAAWIPFERFWMDDPRVRGQGEFLQPFVAALAAWQGRGYTTQFDLAADPKPSFKIAEAGVYYNYMPLPLGWQLSSLSRDYIDLFRGNPEKCDPSQLDRSLENHATRANCVAAQIIRDLTPASTAPAAERSITPAK